MTAPPDPWTEPCDHPNWRDNPDALDQLCEIGARAFHDPHFEHRNVDTVQLQGSYL